MQLLTMWSRGARKPQLPRYRHSLGCATCARPARRGMVRLLFLNRDHQPTYYTLCKVVMYPESLSPLFLWLRSVLRTCKITSIVRSGCKQQSKHCDTTPTVRLMIATSITALLAFVSRNFLVGHLT